MAITAHPVFLAPIAIFVLKIPGLNDNGAPGVADPFLPRGAALNGNEGTCHQKPQKAQKLETIELFVPCLGQARSPSNLRGRCSQQRLQALS